MLSGKAPFTAKTPKELDRKILSEKFQKNQKKLKRFTEKLRNGDQPKKEGETAVGAPVAPVADDSTQGD